jgi:malonyl-CoA O-methyltransferase
VAGVVLVGPPDDENRRAVERWGEVEVLGEIPPLAPLSAATLGDAARTLDPADRIAGMLRQ